MPENTLTHLQLLALFLNHIALETGEYQRKMAMMP